MESLYVLGLQLAFIILLIESISLKIGIVIGLIFLCLVGILLKEKSIFFYVVPFIFVFRIVGTVFDNSSLVKGDKITAKIRVYEGGGEILKINDDYPLKNAVIKMRETQDGEYYIVGKIREIDNKRYRDEYFLEEIDKTKIEESFLKRNFEKLIDSRTQNMSYSEKNLYKSITLGVRDGLHDRVKDLFLKTGLMHILAISGLHIGIILYGLKKFFSIFFFGKRELNITVLIVVTIYFLAIRMSPSAQRAYIMAVIYLLGNIIHENTEMKKSLSAAFVLSLLVNPISYKEVSFIMSYWAMGAIILGEKPLRKISKRIDRRIRRGYKLFKSILNYLCFSIYIQIAMIPITFMIFENFRWGSILASILLTPLGIFYIFLSFINLIVPIEFLCSFIFKILVNSMEFLV